MSINISSLTTEQLLQLNQDVVALIKSRRKRASETMGRKLSLGDVVNVEFRHSTQTGTIKKIMRTRAIVTINAKDWRVPMSMLSLKA